MRRELSGAFTHGEADTDVQTPDHGWNYEIGPVMLFIGLDGPLSLVFYLSSSFFNYPKFEFGLPTTLSNLIYG